MNEATESPAGDKDPKASVFYRFRKWFYASFLHPERITQSLTVLATVALVVFAWRAWTEAQQTTRAIQGQLDVMKADQRPLMWVIDAAPTPQYHDDTGQVSWTWLYNNIGKGMAYNMVFTSYIKLGNEVFQKGRSSNANNSIELLPSEPEDVPPSMSTHPYATVYSRPGIGKDYFSKLLTTDRAIGLLVRFHYTDASGVKLFDNAVCIMRLANGAQAIIPPSRCPIEK